MTTERTPSMWARLISTLEARLAVENGAQELALPGWVWGYDANYGYCWKKDKRRLVRSGGARGGWGIVMIAKTWWPTALQAMEALE